MPEIMMALGEFRFALDTAAYDQLRRSDSYRWQGQDRLGRRPAQQFTGHGPSTVELEGTIYPAFRGGLGQITAMREAADAGTPLEMVDGTGRVWGLWCILDLRETQAVFLADGVPRKLEFSIKLVAYGEDA